MRVVSLTIRCRPLSYPGFPILMIAAEFLTSINYAVEEDVQGRGGICICPRPVNTVGGGSCNLQTDGLDHGSDGRPEEARKQ